MTTKAPRKRQASKATWADQIIAKEGLPKLPGELPEPFNERIPIRNLQVDRTYQREITGHKLDKLRNNFVEAALADIRVSMRNDGSYWIIDGQGRTIVAGEKLGTDYLMRCLVYIDLTVEQEAALFDFFNGTRWNRHTTALQQFKAQVRAKDPTALRIRLAAQRAGFKILESTAGKIPRYGLRCIGALHRAADDEGPEHLERILTIMAKAWQGDAEASHQNVVLGLHALVQRYNGELDEERLVTRLGETPVLQLRRDAANRRVLGVSAGAAMGQTMAALYNHRKTSGRLIPWDEAESRMLARKRKESWAAGTYEGKGIGSNFSRKAT